MSKELFDLYRCSDCGFKFLQDHPDINKIGHYYESPDYISHSDTSKGFSNKIYHLARNIMLSRKMKLVKSVTGLTRGKLLDIGSGTGHFAGKMARSGWSTRGIEINEKARDFSVTHFGLDVLSPGEIHALEGNTFDCITLWHVLEHFEDPFKYASEIIRLLKPGGICLVALPNSHSYDADYYREYWAAWDVPRHLWHFTPSTFSLFLNKTGFIKEDTRSLPLDVFYISILSEKYKGSQPAFIIGFLRGLTFALFSLFSKRNSSSLIYILSKPIARLNHT